MDLQLRTLTREASCDGSFSLLNFCDIFCCKQIKFYCLSSPLKHTKMTTENYYYYLCSPRSPQFSSMSKSPCNICSYPMYLLGVFLIPLCRMSFSLNVSLTHYSECSFSSFHACISDNNLIVLNLSSLKELVSK